MRQAQPEVRLHDLPGAQRMTPVVVLAPSPSPKPAWPTWTCPPKDSLAYAYNFGQIGITQAVLQALAAGPATTADIIRILDACGAPVASVLKGLEPRGLVVRDPRQHPTRWRLAS